MGVEVLTPAGYDMLHQVVGACAWVYAHVFGCARMCVLTLSGLQICLGLCIGHVWVCVCTCRADGPHTDGWIHTCETTVRQRHHTNTHYARTCQCCGRGVVYPRVLWTPLPTPKTHTHRSRRDSRRNRTHTHTFHEPTALSRSGA